MDKERLVKRVKRAYAWDEKAATERVAEYEQFMKLKAAEKDWHATKLSPSPIVDRVWHAHILDTQNYADDCMQAFSRVVHHDPDGEEDPEARRRRYSNTLAS